MPPSLSMRNSASPALAASAMPTLSLAVAAVIGLFFAAPVS